MQLFLPLFFPQICLDLYGKPTISVLNALPVFVEPSPAAALVYFSGPSHILADAGAAS